MNCNKNFRLQLLQKIVKINFHEQILKKNTSDTINKRPWNVNNHIDTNHFTNPATKVIVLIAPVY